jgi:hypothetical protein
LQYECPGESRGFRLSVCALQLAALPDARQKELQAEADRVGAFVGSASRSLPRIRYKQRAKGLGGAQNQSGGRAPAECSNSRRCKMRFRVDVNTLDGKLSFEKDAAEDAIVVAKGVAAKGSLGVTITDTADGTTYVPEDFDKLLRKA